MQQDISKTNSQLLDELRELRQRYTELESAFSNLKEAEENIRAVSETAFDAVLIVDQDANIIFWNKAATEIFGYEEEEIIGKPGTILISEQVMGTYSKGRDHVLEKGFSLFGEKPIESVAKRKDGTEFPAEVTISHWKIGDKYYFGGTFRDISEQKRTEALLRESEKRFKDIFEYATDGIIIADSHTRKFYDGNNAICQMLGYSREELRNLRAENIHPAEYLPFVVEHFDKMVKDDNSTALELPSLRKDGSVFYTELIARPMKLNGRQCLVGFFRDVTERKQAEEERERILNMSQDLICIAGMDGYFKYVNPAWEKILGYPREELLTRPISDFIHPEDHYKNDAAVETLSSGKILSDFDNRYIHKDGSVRNISWTAAPLPEKGLMYCIGRDVTDRKRAEQELINAKDFLERIYNTATDVIMVSDEKGYVANVNQAAEKMLGFTQEELIGKHTSEFFPRDEKHAQIGVRGMAELREKGAIKNFEADWLRKDGSLCPVELNITRLLDGDGNLLGAVAAIRDITERKQNEEALQEREERFRAIAESSLDAIITTDSNGKILYCNKSVEKVYGYTVEELVGKSIAVLEPVALRPGNRKRRKSLVKEGRSSFVGKTAEGIAIRKDGTEVSVEVSSSQWKIGGQIIFGGIARDITERKQMEEQLQKSHAELETKVAQRTAELKVANEKLQISEEYLKNFAGMLLSVREDERKNIATTIHDELGSMAIAIDSHISIAKEECNENNKQNTFKALTNAQAALRKAVESLRRVAVDLRPPNLEIMGLNAALTELIDKVKQQAKFKIILRNELVTKKIPEDRAITIYRVIQEALTNITKHAKAKTVRIRLYADTRDIRLDIADDGTGCDLDKVLYRKGKPKIGIAGMRERVESLGGKFIITSAPKQGTQLKTTLPL